MSGRRTSGGSPGTCSRRLQAVQTPVIPTVAALIRAHPGTISLGQGVVHYPPPIEAGAAAAAFGAEIGDHHYQPVQGLPELRQALAAKLLGENGIEVGDDRVIMVTAGSNMGFFHCLLAIADPGDEVIMVSPFYFNHEMAATMANVRTVLVPSDEGYQPRPEAIEAAITGRTRAVVTVSPNNPAGVVYEPERLRAINAVCRRRGVYHVCDEAYEYFVHGDTPHFSPASLPESSGHTVGLYSFSKAYGMASWRVGYLVGPAHLLPALEKIQDTVLICPPAISQAAALGALAAGRDYALGFLPGLQEVRRMCLASLQELGEQCELSAADGAFYILVRLATGRSDMEVVEHLVRRHGVAVIPGSTFGADDGCHLRIAYGALASATVQEGVARLVGGLRSIAAAPGR